MYIYNIDKKCKLVRLCGPQQYTKYTKYTKYTNYTKTKIVYKPQY